MPDIEPAATERGHPPIEIVASFAATWSALVAIIKAAPPSARRQPTAEQGSQLFAEGAG